MNYSIIKIGLVTSAAIIFFQAVSQLVIYNYVRFDYYATFIALCFLFVGLLMGGKRAEGEERVTNAPENTPNINQNMQHAEMLRLLTTRELQTLQLIYEGKTNKEIAALHFVEVSTVKTHVNNIYSKLAVTNRKEARARYAEMKHDVLIT